MDLRRPRVARRSNVCLQSSRMDFTLRLPIGRRKHQMIIILTNPTSDIWILRLTWQTCWRDFVKTVSCFFFRSFWLLATLYMMRLTEEVQEASSAYRYCLTSSGISIITVPLRDNLIFTMGVLVPEKIEKGPRPILLATAVASHIPSNCSCVR